MKKLDQRGFGTYVEFVDTYGAKVKVKESSSASGPHVWIFIDSDLDVTMPFGDGEDSSTLVAKNGEKLTFPNPRRIFVGPKRDLVASHPVNAQDLVGYVPLKQEASTHLSLEQAKQVRDALNAWLKENE